MEILGEGLLYHVSPQMCSLCAILCPIMLTVLLKTSNQANIVASKMDTRV